MWRAPLLMHVPSNAAQAIPVLMFWEVRRKDFLETFAHHCVTLTLIAYSYSLKCAAKRSDVSGAQQLKRGSSCINLLCHSWLLSVVW